ncbi:MAG TPA: lasso peptide biosynthesis B2 protein, partial [Pyrinomonadaceae bacterium]|nr:lasso peptide biosynthesis B2 protein [Pyrinomonadaceae bacterium]
KFDAAVGTQLARAIDQVLAIDLLVFKPICWKRATVLRRYLSSKGIASRILFGVRNDCSGKVEGHAWLESGGIPILESQPIDYVVTYSFPSNAPCTTELALMSRDQK